MDKDNDKLSIDRKRSTGAALIDGYKLYFRNLDIIIRRTWTLAILYALTCGAIGYHFFMRLMPKLYATSDGMHIDFKEQATELGIFALLIVIFACLVLLMISTVCQALKQHSQTGTMPRSHWYGSVNLKSIPSVLRAIWLIIKHFWRYIALTLVVFIITTIVCLLMESSAIYLSIAHIKAQQSVAMGDQIVMPEYIGLLTFAVFTFCGLLQAYIHISSLFPFYYAYYSKEKIK